MDIHVLEKGHSRVGWVRVRRQELLHHRTKNLQTKSCHVATEGDLSEAAHWQTIQVQHISTMKILSF